MPLLVLTVSVSLDRRARRQAHILLLIGLVPPTQALVPPSPSCDVAGGELVVGHGTEGDTLRGVPNPCFDLGIAGGIEAPDGDPEGDGATGHHLQRSNGTTVTGPRSTDMATEARLQLCQAEHGVHVLFSEELARGVRHFLGHHILLGRMLAVLGFHIVGWV